jgi:anti-sigma regulatory factor (Ser/Thr protein kinase)
MNIVSAKYKANEDGVNVRIQCHLGGDDYISVVIDPDRESYQEIMRQVDAGELTIQDADS